MKRFTFDNLVYYLDENSVLLINLASFRRKKVSTDFLNSIFIIENKVNNLTKLSDNENSILNELYNSKQFLSEDIKADLDTSLRQESVITMDRFKINSLMLNLTHNCNFHCSYCYQNEYKDKIEYKKYMTVNDIDLIKQYINQDIFDSTEMDEVILSGGEVLLPQNIETINYVLSNIKSKKFTIFTNGINLYEYKKYIDYNLIDEFQISLDGTDEIIESVNYFSSNNAFQKIIEGIKYIESLNKKITIVTTWTKQLERHIDRFINLLKLNGITTKENMSIRFCLVKDYYTTKTIDYDFYDIDYICQIIKKINPILSQIGSVLEIYTEGTTLSNIIHRPINEKISLKYKRCNILKSTPMTLEPDGRIFWCLCLDNESGCIGNYKNNIFFNSDKVIKFGNRTIYTIKKCNHCKLKYICAGGCPIPLTSKNSDVNEPVCGLYGITKFWDRLEELV